MTAEFERDGSRERSPLERGERSAGRPDDGERLTGPPRRVLTDGGRAEVGEPADEGDGPESDTSEATQDESTRDGDEETESSAGTEATS
ncbi:hypothetical protein A6E15_10515 [Natrinema saccharevitans]|uniref:Uncharacterized protein n=1 Tax=Natrinema saccharevitans TaxID=301967 RepID=A0A1S8AYF1_9EURY|nr:hypothetical protein [Natrinema saccharevitans]OLZ41394.1 hypothetical protein A6E15_10515 [Natrinema saccharevitans]